VRESGRLAVGDRSIRRRTLRWIAPKAFGDDAKTDRRMRKIFCALPAKRCSISNLGGKAAFDVPTRWAQRVPPSHAWRKVDRLLCSRRLSELRRRCDQN